MTEKSNINFIPEDSKSPLDYKYHPDDPNSPLNKLKFESKQASKFFDPCSETSKMSIKCMEINGKFNKEICSEYFKAYRECKKEWLNQRKRDKLESSGW